MDRLDPHRRRPGRDHPQLTKWDDQPAWPARPASVLRAYWMSNTAPAADLHQPRRRGRSKLPAPPIDAKRYMPPVAGPSADWSRSCRPVARRQEAADPRRPHVAEGRGLEAPHRVAEAIDARVASNLKIGAAFRPIIRCTSAIRRPSPPTISSTR
jgi:hypothetical protein